MTTKMKLVKVTPDLAHKWLATNHDNRPVREYLVKSYAEDMASGDWADNGQTIKFDVNDELIDGQHRLLAVIQSNCTIEMWVAYGVQRKARTTVDTGAKMTFANLLTMRKEKNAPILASIVRKVYIWRKGLQLGKVEVASNAMLDRVLEEYPWLRDVARESSGIAGTTNLMASVVGWCWFTFFQINPDDCKAFFERLSDQHNSIKGNPIDALKRKLNKLAQNDHERRSDVWMAAVTVKAWNKFRDGESWQVVDFQPGGVTNEKMPVAH